jgi:hypothetical protein
MTLLEHFLDEYTDADWYDDYIRYIDDDEYVRDIELVSVAPFHVREAPVYQNMSSGPEDVCHYRRVQGLVFIPDLEIRNMSRRRKKDGFEYLILQYNRESGEIVKKETDSVNDVKDVILQCKNYLKIDTRDNIGTDPRLEQYRSEGIIR